MRSASQVDASDVHHCVNASSRVFVTPSIASFMTVTEALREYREYMSRMDVAFAFGHGCSMSGSDPRLRALRAEADRLLVQLRILEAAVGTHPLNTPGRCVKIEFHRQ
jgi:hypothetical protein